MISRRLVISIAALALCISGEAPAQNIILMISDGAGFNTFNAANMYLGSDAMAGIGFDVAMGMQTYSASNPDGQYDASGMWSSMNWAKDGPTDSASAATAMYTGQKNYDGQVNWSTSGQPLTTIFEVAANNGMATGAVSTVQLSHATPAAVSAHNVSRNNYAQIANEMIYTSQLDVIMGAGHPLYNDSGTQVRTTPSESQARFVGGVATWNDMKDGSVNGFTYIETAEQFANLANGTLSASKVIGVAQAATTLQQSRTGSALNTNVPTLATMSVGALNILGQNSNGFAVMIEGGAVDWAGHGNQSMRLVEEQIDFVRAVAEVCAWVETNSSWEETLLIVTADHETGFVTDLTNNGVGVVPGMAFNSGDHTNSLVPLFAKGLNAGLLTNNIVGTDNIGSAAYFGANSRSYIDNTTVFDVMATVVPEPTTIGLLGLGSVIFIRRRRS